MYQVFLSIRKLAIFRKKSSVNINFHFVIVSHKHQGGDNMYKAYKFWLYLNDKQKELINKTFGCTKFVHNYFLNQCKENGYQKAYDMFKKLKEL